MSTYIKETQFLGQPAIIAGTDQVEVILVPSWGSNLISINYKPKKMEILRVPNSREAYQKTPMLYGTPILFPPNRIEDGRFTFNNKTYHFQVNEAEYHNHIHGFLYDREWECVDYKQNNNLIQIITEFDSFDHPEVYQQFPYHFKIRMTYIIKGASITKIATIMNRDKESFPWGFGYHTTVQFPFVPGSSLRKCFVSLPVEKRWQLNDRFLPTGKLEETDYLPQMQKGICIENRSFDDVLLTTQNKNSNQTSLIDKNSGIQLHYTCDQNFKHWVIYNGDGDQGFFCPEPYTWVTNAPNIELPAELTGLQVLGSDEEVELVSEIKITKI